MKAHITHKDYDGRIPQNRKENHFYKQYTVVTKDFTTPVVLRIYVASVKHYACLWVNDRKTGTHISGGGNASGYGYHKSSAAVADALSDAGIILDTSISGVGDSAIQEALEAVTRTLGYRRSQFTILSAHA